ncbi:MULTISPECIES: hypothetical protein [Fischerella]|nr:MULTISPECIES: hypothetical protein [Fischerella]
MMASEGEIDQAIASTTRVHISTVKRTREKNENYRTHGVEMHI